MSDRQFQIDLLALLFERNELLRENNRIMATLDEDVQTATTLLNQLVAQVGAGSGVSAADQTALETAIAAAQAVVTPAAAPTEPVSSPEVA